MASIAHLESSGGTCRASRSENVQTLKEHRQIYLEGQRLFTQHELLEAK